MSAIGRPDYPWPSIVGVNLSKLGRINYNSARDRHRDQLSSYYLERYATILEMPNAIQRAKLPTTLNQLRPNLIYIIIILQGENVKGVNGL
jgi:hypothetical protein